MADVIAELKAMIAGMSEAEKAELDQLIAPELGRKWLPSPGPQTDAYLSKADLLLFGGQAGGGKALALDTPIPTPDGWTTMGALKIGDRVFDERGQECRVTFATEVMIGRPCYRLRFSDGAEIVADADHKWLTSTDLERLRLHRQSDGFRERRKQRRQKRGTGKKPWLADLNTQNAAIQALPLASVRNTQEIYETCFTKRGALNHSVEISAPVACEEKTVAIDPYLLGAWLGDGTSACAAITTADEEIFQAFSSAGYGISDRGAYSYGLTGTLQTALRGYGLLKNKHVPSVYLRGSVEQRTALLQGLMDTDGFCDQRGQCVFYTTKRVLADGALELITSLGCKATITEGRARLYGKDCGPKYAIKFMAPFPAFRLPRKLMRQKLSGFRDTVRRRYIESVEPVASVPVRCIQVNSRSHLYLASKQFIPTHNTDLLAGLSYTEHHRSVIFRRAYVDLRGITERLLEIAQTRDGWNGQEKVFRRGKKLIEFGALEKPDAEKAWQGRDHDFIGFDEGAQLSAAKVLYVMGWLRSSKPGQRCRAVIASNPPIGGEGDWLLIWFAPWLDPLFPKPAEYGELRWCYQLGEDVVWVDGPGETVLEDSGELKTYKHESRTFIPSRLDDNPFLRDTAYRGRLQNMPEPLRSILLEGDFLAGREDHAWQVIPSEWVRLANERWKKAPQKRRQMIALSCDVAMGGVDNTSVACLHQDCWFAPIQRKPGAECREPEDVAMFMLKHQRDGADLSVDGTGGWGSGVRSNLKTAHQLDCELLIYSKGSQRRTKDGKFGYANLRADMYWTFREALDPENGDEVMLPPDPRLMAQLTAARYTVRKDNILIEDKEEIKKRVGASPDDADAVVMAWRRRLASLKKARKTAPDTKRERWGGVSAGSGWMGV